MSGSKDSFIRIWKISLKKKEKAMNSDELKLEEQKFSVNETGTISVKFVSFLFVD